MVEKGEHLADNEVVHLMTLGPAPYVEPEHQRRFRQRNCAGTRSFNLEYTVLHDIYTLAFARSPLWKGACTTSRRKCADRRCLCM